MTIDPGAIRHSAARDSSRFPARRSVGVGTREDRRWASALHAEHPPSLDHDDVLADLTERYAEIVEAVEASEGWVTSVRASSPPHTPLGSLDGVEAGLRQRRRTRPLEVEDVDLGAGVTVRVPTLPKMLRVKAYLVVQRNATRDYLDTAATHRAAPPARDHRRVGDQWRRHRDGPGRGRRDHGRHAAGVPADPPC